MAVLSVLIVRLITFLLINGLRFAITAIIGLVVCNLYNKRNDIKCKSWVWVILWLRLAAGVICIAGAVGIILFII